MYRVHSQPSLTIYTCRNPDINGFLQWKNCKYTSFTTFRRSTTQILISHLALVNNFSPAPTSIGLLYQWPSSLNMISKNNVFLLILRCPTYKIQPGCTWVTDPADPCCQVPQCLSTPTPAPYRTPAPGATTPKGQTPTIGPNVTPTFTPYPSPLPQGVTGSVIGKPQVPSLRGMSFIVNYLFLKTNFCCKTAWQFTNLQYLYSINLFQETIHLSWKNYILLAKEVDSIESFHCTNKIDICTNKYKKYSLLIIYLCSLI